MWNLPPRLAPCLLLLLAPSWFAVTEPPAHHTRDPLAALRSGLRDRSPRTRRGAVRAAASVGTRDAWRLVVEALADRESEVADEAQLQLGNLAEGRVLSELLQAHGLRSRAPGVRERVAEALGRMPLDLDAGTLAKRISTRPADLECARMLLWTLERQARAGRLRGDAERAIRVLTSIAASRRDPRLRGEALLALDALDPGGSSTRLTEALRDREPALRCAALVAAARARDVRGLTRASGASVTSVTSVTWVASGAGGLDWARAAIADPDARVRAAALDLLEALGTREAMRSLIERLESEPMLRLRWRALGALQRRSSMKYRFDPRPWKLWVEGLDEDWSAPAREPIVRRVASQAQGLVGFPVRSERVVFLFDFSGSMWTEDASGRTPKDVVEVELRRALELLPEETRFNLIPFTYGPLPWKPRLVSASKRNVRAALKFFEDCNARGRGNFYDAALLALADPEVDTLVVLTDGEPTGGTHSNMDLVASLFLHQNRLRCVTIDALLVDAPSGIFEQWEELARATGGTAIEVRL